MPEGVVVDEELVAKLENGVLWLTINRADKGNAIPYYVRDRLTEWFWDAHSDLDVRAIVLTGAGERHFCTGADLSVRQPAGKPKPEGAPDMVVGGATQMMRLGFQRLMQAMLDCEKPIIVSLNGTAAGRRFDVRARRRPRDRGRHREDHPGVRAPLASFPTAASRTCSPASWACTRRRS